VITTFTCEGPPQPKERARACSNGKHITPKKTRAYERLVGTIAGLQRPRMWRLDGRYRVEMRAYFGDARARDVDNVAKSVLDGLNRVLWHDDRQVVRVACEKFVDRARPRIEVWVELIEQLELGTPRPPPKEAAR
jgi:Holliday junction resolvase RusA-like endonuclease